MVKTSIIRIMGALRLTALLAVVFSAATALAQNVTTPYSMYGYGVVGDRATSMQRQMGGIGYAMNSGRQVNVMNPASYAHTDSLTFLFDMGADLSILWSKDSGDSHRSTGGGLDYITMQFPLSKYMGASIGLLPYTSVGYAFGNEIAHGTMTNQGQGGINEAYVGVSGKIGGFSLGVNISYDFGNIINDVFSNPVTGGQSKFEHVMQIRDWGLLLGAQYTQRLSKADRLTLGLTFAPKKTLLGKSWATVQEMSLDELPDTVGYLNLKNNYYTPMSIGVGVSFSHERSSKWMAEADFTFQQWEKARYSAMTAIDNPKEVVFQGMDFKNRMKVAAGGEFVPKLRGNYLQRMAYRLGAHYTLDYIAIGSHQVKEYGVSGGFGLPTAEGKTMVNLGFGWQARNAGVKGLLKENYFNITLGVNFNEVWFWKRKIK